MAASRRSLTCLFCAAIAMGWYVWTALATAEGPSRTGTLLVLSSILSVVMITISGPGARLPSWAVGVGAACGFLFLRSAVAADEFSGESPVWLLGQTLLVLSASAVLHHLTAIIPVVQRHPMQTSGRPRATDLAEAVRVEMARARRHERPLSVAVLQRTSAAGAAARQPYARYLERVEWNETVEWLVATCRRPDIVVPHHATNAIVIVAPETDHVAMESLAERVRVRVVDAMQGEVELHVGIASFPDDGFSFAALVDAARARMPMAGGAAPALSIRRGAPIGA